MNLGELILLIDDEAVRLRPLDLLEPEQTYDICEISDGRFGFAAVSASTPDLALFDLMKLGVPGFAVCAVHRADVGSRALPVIVLSPADDRDTMRTEAAAGADGFVSESVFTPNLRALAVERDLRRWLGDLFHEPLNIPEDFGLLVYAKPPAPDLFDFGAGGAADVARLFDRRAEAESEGALAACRDDCLRIGSSFMHSHSETSPFASRWFEGELHAVDGVGGQTLMKFTNRTRTHRRELASFTLQRSFTLKTCASLSSRTPSLECFEATEEDADLEKVDLLNMARRSAEILEGAQHADYRFHVAVVFSLTRSCPTVVRNVRLSGRVISTSVAGAEAQPEMKEFVLGERWENYVKLSDTLNSGITTSWSSEGEKWELRFFAPGPGSLQDVIVKLGQPYRKLERNFSGDLPGMGRNRAIARALWRPRGGDFQFFEVQAGSERASTVVQPPHFVRTT